MYILKIENRNSNKSEKSDDVLWFKWVYDQWVEKKTVKPSHHFSHHSSFYTSIKFLTHTTPTEKHVVWPILFVIRLFFRNIIFQNFRWNKKDLKILQMGIRVKIYEDFNCKSTELKNNLDYLSYKSYGLYGPCGASSLPNWKFFGSCFHTLCAHYGANWLELLKGC